MDFATAARQQIGQQGVEGRQQRAVLAMGRQAGESEFDPLCPQSNRPKPVNGQCHIDFGIPLASGVTLSQPPAGQKYCTQFVMGDPATLASGDPDARQQAPFEVGDTITYASEVVEKRVTKSRPGWGIVFGTTTAIVFAPAISIVAACSV